MQVEQLAPELAVSPEPEGAAVRPAQACAAPVREGLGTTATAAEKATDDAVRAAQSARDKQRAEARKLQLAEAAASKAASEEADAAAVEAAVAEAAAGSERGADAVPFRPGVEVTLRGLATAHMNGLSGIVVREKRGAGGSDDRWGVRVLVGGADKVVALKAENLCPRVAPVPARGGENPHGRPSSAASPGAQSVAVVQGGVVATLSLMRGLAGRGGGLEPAPADAVPAEVVAAGSPTEPKGRGGDERDRPALSREGDDAAPSSETPHSGSDSGSSADSDDWDEDEDEESLRARIEEDPRDHDATHRLGKLLISEGDTHEGEKLLRLATKLAPDELGYHFELAYALYDRNDLQGALRAIRKEIDLCCEDHEEMGQNHFLRGDILRDRGDLKSAVDAYAKAYALDPCSEYRDTLDEQRLILQEADSKGRRLVANVEAGEATTRKSPSSGGVPCTFPLGAADKRQLGDLCSKVDKWSKQARLDLAHVLEHGGNLEKFPLNYVLINGFDVSIPKTTALQLVALAPESWGDVLSDYASYYSELLDLAGHLEGETKSHRARFLAAWGQSGHPTADFLKRERKKVRLFAEFWGNLLSEVTSAGPGREEVFPQGMVAFVTVFERFVDACGQEFI